MISVVFFIYRPRSRHRCVGVRRCVVSSMAIIALRTATSTPCHSWSFLCSPITRGSAIEIARQFERVAEKARTDALTGLAHHGTLMEELGRAASLALASSQPLGVVMVDLDDFKRVNDTLGHLVGDALLAGIAARLRAVVRNDEAPYRYGGEEFTIILPGADREAAMAVGERLRSAVGSRAFEVGCESPIEVTCSIGVASLPQDGQDAQSVVAAADEALLEAKARGKDRICAAR